MHTHTHKCTLDLPQCWYCDIAEDLGTILWRKPWTSAVSSQLCEAEMHLYNPLLKGETSLPSCLCAAVSLFFSLCYGWINCRCTVFARLLLNCATWQLETTHMLRILICFVCHLVFVCLRKEVSFVICCVHMQGFFFFFLVFTQSEAISSLLFCMVLMPISLYNLLISPERRNSSLFCFAPPFFFVSLEGLIEKWKKYQCAHRLC